MSMKVGIKKNGQKGNDTLMNELRQLHERKLMLLKRKDKFTHEDRQKALRSLMFIKEK